MGPLHKVKGHMTEEAAFQDPHLARCKSGNDLADHRAKLGTLAHERPSAEREAWLRRALAACRKLCVLAARVLPAWPPRDLSRATRDKLAPRPPPRACGRHEWAWR
eukprot:5492694-Pyramimonas_sp.AAC.1